MKRVVLRDDAADELIAGGPTRLTARIEGELADVTIELSSSDQILFPAVWFDGERMYDVEVWRGERMIFTVPPRSDEVDASFDEHEHYRPH